MASTINADTSNGVIITPDTSGEIELQANGVTKAKVTANGLQDANGNSLRGGMYRNLIINGDMRIAQRGTSSTGQTASGYKTCDRFYINIDTIGTWTITRDTNVPAGQGFSNSLKMACTTADASLSANDALLISYRTEGQHLQHIKKGTANAESLTLSFWVKSNKTGTYVAELSDADNTRAISKSYTIDLADTWEKKTITYEGDTTGTLDNNNAVSLYTNFWIGAGTTWTSGTSQTSWGTRTNGNRAYGLTVNLADSTSNYINITGVQLEVGEGASDFEFLPYDVQLARCERYYQTNRTSGGYSSPSGNDVAFYIPLYPQMRATPNVGIISLSNKIGDYYSADRTGTSLGSNFSNISNISYNQIVIVTTTANKWHALHNNAIYFDAEL